MSKRRFSSCRKGQSALEYMMTYGWAILVVIIIGYVVWQTGMLEIGKNVTPGKRGFSQITPTDWRLNSDGTFRMIIQNDAGVILDIVYSNMTFNSGGTGPCTVDNGQLPMLDFRPAEIGTITFSGCQITAKQGEYYRMDVTIKYYNPSSDLTHVSRGMVWGPVE